MLSVTYIAITTDTCHSRQERGEDSLDSQSTVRIQGRNLHKIIEGA